MGRVCRYVSTTPFVRSRQCGGHRLIRPGPAGTVLYATAGIRRSFRATSMPRYKSLRDAVRRWTNVFIIVRQNGCSSREGQGVTVMRLALGIGSLANLLFSPSRSPIPCHTLQVVPLKLGVHSDATSFTRIARRKSELLFRASYGQTQCVEVAKPV